MAFTSGQILALEAQIAAARQSIQDGDKSITLASLQDQLALLDRMRAEVAAGAGTRAKVHFVKYSGNQ